MSTVLTEGPVPGTFEVVPVEMEPEKEAKWVKSLLAEIESTLNARAELEEKWKTAVAQYHACLKREDAEPGESKLDMPSTREFADMAAARLINTVFARPEIFLCKPRRPDAMEFASQLEKFMDWCIDRTEFRFFVEDIIRTGLVYTKAVAKIPYVCRTKKIIDYEREVYNEDGSLEHHWGAAKDSHFYPQQRLIVEEQRAVPEFIPTPDFIHPSPCASIADAPWVVHRVWKTREQLARCIERMLYREKTPSGESVIEKVGSGDSGPETKFSLGINAADPDSDGGPSRTDQLEILEIYTTIHEQETILTVERRTGVVLRWVYNFYFDYQRPFATWCYERVPGDIDGISLCFLLEPMHRAISACFNQSLDSSSKAMECLVLFNELSGLASVFKDGKIRSGAFPMNALDDISKQVTKFDLSQPFSPLTGIVEKLEVNAQKLAGLTDYNAGIEQIQRPTASGQIALLEEGKQPMYSRMESLREFLKVVALQMVARYRQFNPIDIEFYLQSRTEEEASEIREVLQWPEEYWRDQVILETAVSSQSMSRDLRKQEWLALVDKMPQVIGQIMQLAEAAMTPGPMAAVAAKMLQWQMAYAVQPWLAEFEVAGREFLDIGEEMQVGQMFTQMVQELQGQIQQLQQQSTVDQQTIERLTGMLEHVTRAYTVKTGKLPPPPPRGQGRSAPSPAGMGGGSIVPGESIPEEGSDVAPVV